MPREQVWVAHPDIAAPRQVSRSALIHLGPSGWVELSATDVKKHAKARRDAKAADEAAMTPAAAPQNAPSAGGSTKVPPAEGATPEKES